MTSGIPEDEEFQLSFDEIFESLSHASRRWLLTRLSDVGHGDAEESISEESIRENEVMEPFVSEIFDRHLPLLDEAELIDWDRERQSIERGSRFDEITPIMQLIADHQDELSREWP